MKKILFIGDAESIHLKKYTDYFLSKDYDVHLATFSLVNHTNVNNVYFLSKKKVKNSGKNYHYLFSINKLSKIIKNIEPNYVNAHFSYSMGLIAYLALRLTNVECSFSIVCHGSDILDFPLKICNLINKFVLSKADKVISVSNQITDRILNYGIDNNKIFTGQYGVNLNDTKNVEERDIDFISIRNYVPNSRIDEILKIVGSKKYNEKKIVFVLPKISDEKFDLIEKTYKKITFYKYVKHVDLLKILKRSKFYISATKSDGSSLSLMEAMVSGTIPIVSNIPSNREWIVDGLNGRLFRSFEELDEILSEQIIDYDSARKLNFDLIYKKGDYNKQMERIERFLTKI